MAWLLLLCGVFSFAYGMESLMHRNAHNLMGLPAAALCFLALLLGQHYQALLLFYVGIGLYCGLRIWKAEIKFKHKLFVSVLLYGIVIL